jgi:hypothetical protein
MLKRLVFGLIFGLLVGGLLAAAVVKGVGMLAFTGTGGTVLAYVFAAVTGVLVGLVAGKPIWASGGQIEAGLKAVVGAGVAAAAMWAMRRWLSLDVDLHSMGLGPATPTSAGLLPVATLPVIAALLGAFYEADNTPAAADEKSGAKSSKGKDDAGAKKAKVRVAENAADEEDEAVESGAGKKQLKK